MIRNYKYEETLPVGIIQTTIDAPLAWPPHAVPKMSDAQDAHVWREICRAMRSFVDGSEKPRIVLLPELSLPLTRLNDFEKMVAALNVIAIVGVDYRLDFNGHHVRNEGIVFIPTGFWKDRPSRSCARVKFGKSHPAPKEKWRLEALSPAWKFVGDANVYVFDCEKYGDIGVSICYDFMDIERALIYRGRVHHLFVLAYNQDVGMFRSLAESLSRTIFCNVVVCNTGFFGGSIVLSPYRESHRRTLFSHAGSRLYTSQVVHLPVKGINDARSYTTGTGAGAVKNEFKDPPPGVNSYIPLEIAPKRPSES